MFVSQDYNVWCDLRRLEHRLKVRWLTHESDEERWENYRIRNNLSINDFGSIISTSYREEPSNDDEGRDKFNTGGSFHRSRAYEQADINNRNTNGKSHQPSANNGNTYSTGPNNSQYPFSHHNNATTNSRL